MFISGRRKKKKKREREREREREIKKEEKESVRWIKSKGKRESKSDMGQWKKKLIKFQTIVAM